MLKVALVDDEQWILDDLENLIDWEKEGYVKGGRAKNGIEALYLVEKVRPDLVIMDIKMPGLSGLEVLEKMRKKGIHIPVIILTAHSEFSYAQQALALGAFNYLLKPVEEEKLLEQIRLAADKIQKERRDKEELKQLEFLKLLFGAVNSPEDVMVPGEQSVQSEDSLYICAVAKGQHLEEEIFRFIGTIEGISQLRYVQVGNGKHAFLLEASRRLIDNKAIKSIYRKAISFIKKHNVSVGLSVGFNNLSSLGAAYRQADSMAYSYFVIGRNGLFFYRKKNENRINSILEKIKRCKTKEELKKIIDGLPRYAKRIKADIREIDKIYAAILSWLEYNGVSAELTVEREIIYSYENIEDMSLTIKEYLDYNGVIHKNTSNAVITVIKEYVEKHYQERLTTNVFAKRFHMNASYLSNLFKIETGTSFTNYLIDIRLNKAGEFLKNTDLPVNIISEKIGYDDCFHFSKLFKKYRGMSPSEYRIFFNQ